MQSIGKCTCSVEIYIRVTHVEILYTCKILWHSLSIIYIYMWQWGVIADVSQHGLNIDLICDIIPYGPVIHVI